MLHLYLLIFVQVRGCSLCQNADVRLTVKCRALQENHVVSYNILIFQCVLFLMGKLHWHLQSLFAVTMGCAEVIASINYRNIFWFGKTLYKNHSVMISIY